MGERTQMNLSPAEWATHALETHCPDEWAEAFQQIIRPGETVLELGCGGGGLARHLIDYGCQVTGLDFSLDALAKFPTSKTVCADATKRLPFKAHTFDVVVSSGLLEHFDDLTIVAIIKEAKRVSKRAVVSAVPNANCLGYMAWKQAHETNGTWTYGDEFPKDSLSEEYWAAGFREVFEWSADTTSFGGNAGYLLMTAGYHD